MSTINYTTNQGSNDPQEILHILNGNVKPKKQSITKSFRLDQDIINKINEQVKHNNNSLNAEINGILRKYIDWDMLASKVGMVPIAKPIVLEIFQNIMTKEQVIDLANNEARNVIRETVQFMKGNLTLESFLSWLKTRMELCSNVNYAMENNSQQIRMIFKHDLGENWSIYHKIVIEDILYEILGESINVGIDVSPTTLVLCFRKGEYR
jgi:hypothetical protein